MTGEDAYHQGYNDAENKVGDQLDRAMRAANDEREVGIDREMRLDGQLAAARADAERLAAALQFMDATIHEYGHGHMGTKGGMPWWIHCTCDTCQMAHAALAAHKEAADVLG